MLLKFTPKTAEVFPDGFKDRDGFYYGMRATLSVIAYNPKIVSDKDAPKTWKDLLNPKWKGKLVTAHPSYSGIIMTHVAGARESLRLGLFPRPGEKQTCTWCSPPTIPPAS